MEPCSWRALILVFFLLPLLTQGRTRHYKFNVVAKNFTRLCSPKSIITVNGRFPGPTLYAREGDTVVVKVANHVQENVTIHWHGVRQLTTGWADGPAYVTQCPIQPGQNYAYNFTLTGQRGTLLWHAHIMWQRATVHGAIVILPKRGVPYPFPAPHKEVVLIMAEWWKSDVEAVINEALQSGFAPNVSDAHTINGHAGPVSGCASSARDGFTLRVDQGKTYLLRIINAALNDDLFFKVAGHLMTVVEVDATYTKPFTIDTLLIAPGQTTNVLLTADQGAGRYLVTASPFMDSPLVAVDNSTGTATVQYTDAVSTSAIATTKLPPRNSTSLASQFIDSLRSLNSKQYPANVPSTVDHSLLFTVGLGVNPCPACTNGSRVVAAMNNVTFMMPTTALLQAHYFNMSGVFTNDFPGQPLIAFNYTGSGPNNTQTMNGTRLYRLPYNASVQLVLQDTGIIGPESHPIHLHGYNFFVVGRGVGNYDPATSPSKFNLVDPIERNTMAVPAAGWTAIRFRADNPDAGGRRGLAEMAVQTAETCFQWSRMSRANSLTPSPAAFPAAGPSLGCRNRQGSAVHVRDRVLASPFLGAVSAKLLRVRLLDIRRRRGEKRALRRAFSGSLQRFEAEGDDYQEENDELFIQKPQEFAIELQQQRGGGYEEGIEEAAFVSPASSSDSSPSSFSLSVSTKHEPLRLPVWPEPPDWLDQIVPAIVEKNANSVELPLSLRIIKRKKRWEDGWFREASESAFCSVNRAFSSMVFMIRELQSYTLQMREFISSEDLQGILARVQREMNSSFVWLFQQIFSCTPTLMVSVMLLLANFTVYSMGHLDAAAMAAPNPPAQSLVETTVVVEDRRHLNHHDRSSIKTFSSIGRTASIGGSGPGGGGKAKPVSGATGDGRSDDEGFSYRTSFADGTSTAPRVVDIEESGEGRRGDGALVAAPRAEEEVRVWRGILEEVSRLQATTRDEALMDQETLWRLVSPVTAEPEPDDYSEYLRTEIMYQQTLSQDPENALLVANFAQFLYLVLHDHDRAEYYFKRAAGLEPADAEALSQYASFLWLARKDMAAAEETYLQAIAADPSNPFHTANYAHFLWSTGAEDTCYPLDTDDAWQQ
ncbi:unnamed protein product [Musa acuminata var. zebrina]